jgi:hypothetical protein
MIAMIRILPATIALLFAAVPAVAQTAAQLQKELKTKEAAAKKDPEALFEVGKWAAEKSLAKESKRLLEAVLKINPGHAGANEALGNELVEGKWLPAKEAEALRKKAQAAEYAAKGFVEVGGVWVEKDKVEDAKRGVFHHNGEMVTKDEMVAFLAGKVRHPVTGEIIDATNAGKAKDGYFPAGAKWVDQKEADTFHSDVKRPWHLRTQTATILSTLELVKIQDLGTQVDIAIERVSQDFFAKKAALPGKRPVVAVAASTNEYREIGRALGDGTDACGAFLIRDDSKMSVPFVGDVRGAVCNNEKDWGPRYARHAGALAYVNAIAEEAGADLPLWLLHGIGSYTSRFQNDGDASWFGKQHVAKGGVRNLKTFFSAFAINGDMESKDVDYNIYQAGLLLKFAKEGGDATVTEALQGVLDLLTGSSKGNLDKALGKLQTQLMGAEQKVAAYLQALIAKG